MCKKLFIALLKTNFVELTTNKNFVFNEGQ